MLFLVTLLVYASIHLLKERGFNGEFLSALTRNYLGNYVCWLALKDS